jgi:hypothetical protein
VENVENVENVERTNERTKYKSKQPNQRREEKRYFE